MTAICVLSCSLRHSLLTVSVASGKSLVELLLGIVLVSKGPVLTKSWLCLGLPVLKRIIASVKDLVSMHVALLAPSAEV